MLYYLNPRKFSNDNIIVSFVNMEETELIKQFSSMWSATHAMNKHLVSYLTNKENKWLPTLISLKFYEYYMENNKLNIHHVLSMEDLNLLNIIFHVVSLISVIISH